MTYSLLLFLVILISSHAYSSSDDASSRNEDIDEKSPRGFKEMFLENSQIVDPVKGQCTSDVYNLLIRAKAALEGFDATKLQIYEILKYQRRLFSQHRIHFRLQDMGEDISDFSYHILPVYDGVVYDFATKKICYLDEYLKTQLTEGFLKFHTICCMDFKKFEESVQRNKRYPGVPLSSFLKTLQVQALSDQTK